MEVYALLLVINDVGTNDVRVLQDNLASISDCQTLAVAVAKRESYVVTGTGALVCVRKIQQGYVVIKDTTGK